jgi:hypothetical protein
VLANAVQLIKFKFPVLINLAVLHVIRDMLQALIMPLVFRVKHRARFVLSIMVLVTEFAPNAQMDRLQMVRDHAVLARPPHVLLVLKARQCVKLV